MLDTDISSYIIKRRPAALVEKFEKHGETLNMSAITAAKLRFGAEKAARPKLAELVEAYLDRLAILDWTNEVTAAMHGFAQSWSVSLTRSGIWIFSAPHTPLPTAWSIGGPSG
jgi:predicted nucleic acid-binding protein